MADVEFSRADIDGLAEKIATLQPQLSQQEQALLLAIFAAAANQSRSAGTGNSATLRAAQVSLQPQDAGSAGPVTLPDLRYQLLNAYTPGNDFDSATSDPHVDPFAGHKVGSVYRADVPPPSAPDE